MIGSEKLEVSENNGRQYHRLKVTPRVVARVMRAPKNQGNGGNNFSGNQGGGLNQQQGGYQQAQPQQGNQGGQIDPWQSQSDGNYQWGNDSQEVAPF